MIDRSGTFGTRDDIVLALTPKRPRAQYKTLHLVVASDNYRVRQSIITDAAGNTNAFTFYAPDTKKPVAAGWFELDASAVKGFRVIDADQKAP